MLDGEEMDEGLSVPLRQAIRRNPNLILLPRRHLRLQKFVEKLVDFARKQSDVWVFSNGRAENVDPVMVAGDGTITAGTYPQTKEFNGGFTVLDVPSREAALEWAAKIAAACRCAQEIREFMPDPAVGN